MDDQEQKIINDCCFKCSDYLRIVLSEPANLQKALDAAFEASCQVHYLVQHLGQLRLKELALGGPLGKIEDIETT